MSFLDFSEQELRITDKELRAPGVQGIDVEIIELEEIVLEDFIPTDRRLSYLSPTTRFAITRLFGGDVDEAEHVATKLAVQYRSPPTWAVEIHGLARAGWKHYNREGRV